MRFPCERRKNIDNGFKYRVVIHKYLCVEQVSFVEKAS